jgi:ABC-type phosphate/phosphonate transport system permease subunit
MSMRLGRLQRQSRRAFRASDAPEVSTSELASWCWARQTLMERRALSRWQRESMIRAARSIGAVRARRIGREWLWRLPDAVAANTECP